MNAGHRSYEAVIIGAGPNGLTAANVLADAGWRVLLLEAQDAVGGAVASDDSVQDGFIHDTFSSFYPLAAASPVLKSMNLDRFGLTWSHAPAVVGSPAADQGWALIHHDPRDTANGLEQLHPGDGDAWERMYAQWSRIGDAVVDALLSPFPPVRAGIRAALALRKVGGLSFVRMLLRTLADPDQHPPRRIRGPTTDRRERRPRRHPTGCRRVWAVRVAAGDARPGRRVPRRPRRRRTPRRRVGRPAAPPAAGTSGVTPRSPVLWWSAAVRWGCGSPTARSSTPAGR